MGTARLTPLLGLRLLLTATAALLAGCSTPGGPSASPPPFSPGG